jgi:hypothetical protein
MSKAEAIRDLRLLLAQTDPRSPAARVIREVLIACDDELKPVGQEIERA